MTCHAKTLVLCALSLLTSCGRGPQQPNHQPRQLTESQVLEFCKQLEGASLRPDVDVTMSFFAPDVKIVILNGHKPDQPPVTFDKARYHAHMKRYFQTTTDLTGKVTKRKVTLSDDLLSARVETLAHVAGTRGNDRREWTTEKTMVVTLVGDRPLVSHVTATSMWKKDSNQ